MFSFNALVQDNRLIYLFLVFLCVIIPLAIRRAPWRQLAANAGLQHLFGGSIVLLVLIWSIKGQLASGFDIHFLGVTVLTLVLGWDLALLSALSALSILSVWHGLSWQSWVVNAVITVSLQVAVTQLVFTLVDRKMVKNFFVYLFLCGFFCAALNAAILGFTLAGVIGLATAIEWPAIQRDVITIIPLTLFPEGLLNGVLLTAVMVFYPDWIRSFDAKQYIDQQ